MDPKQVLSRVVQKQIAIFGSKITAMQLQDIKGLVVDVQGNVMEFSGKSEELAKAILASWERLSPFLAQKIAVPLLLPLMPQQNQNQTQQ